MLAAVADLLRCPHCTQPFTLLDRTLRCPAGHSFDLAKQGYVNLLSRPVKGSNADTAAMVGARDRFLSRGHYRPLADRLVELADPAPIPTSTGIRPVGAPAHRPVIAEFGAGTGYYLTRMLDGLPGARGIATDLSPIACRRAARAHDQLGAVVADTWQRLPIADEALDLIMVVFAPRNPAEFARLLRPGGRLLVAAAGGDHLAELRGPLGLLEIEPGKQQRLTDQLAGSFTLEYAETLRRRLTLSADDLLDLVSMGPNAHHQDDQLRSRIEALAPPVEVSCVVELALFRR